MPAPLARAARTRVGLRCARARARRSLFANTLGRSVFLMAIFTPSLLLSPLLLFDYTERLWWRLSLRALSWAGPCFLKFGQWAATRPDLFPRRVCERLSQLHDGCPAHSLDDTRAIVRDALGHSIDELFVEFGAEPIASGTVAQVYRARTRDGQDVAVKVAHPDVAALIERDLRLLHALASLVQLLPRMEFMAMREAVEQVATRPSVARRRRPTR